MYRPTKLAVRLWAVSAVCAVAAATMWIASFSIFGQREPWDVPEPYAATLLVLGLAGGAFLPSRYSWLPGIAVWVGQTFGFLSLAISEPLFPPLMPFGLVFFLPLYSLLSLHAACVGSQIGAWFMRFMHAR